MAGTREYDPNFYFPSEFEEMVVKDFDYDPSAEDDNVDESNVNDYELDDESNSDEESDLQDVDTTSNSIEVPDSLTVVSQTVRTAPDGSQVVDVVVEVDDIAEAVQFDMRVTPA